MGRMENNEIVYFLRPFGSKRAKRVLRKGRDEVL